MVLDCNLCPYRLDKVCKEEMTENVNFLTKTLDEGIIIYGVNTGYGGRYVNVVLFICYINCHLLNNVYIYIFIN